MQTGENEQALRKIIDFTRLLGIIVLMLHFYFACYAAFRLWHITYPLVDRVLTPVARLFVFRRELFAKAAALLLLIVSLIGTKARKDEHAGLKTAIGLIVFGLSIYMLSGLILTAGLSLTVKDLLYIMITALGFLLFIAGVSQAFRLIHVSLNRDVFNTENETFPQEERLLTNEHSINLPARYYYKGGYRDSWINIIQPYRALLNVSGPGGGKSYFVVRHVITQHIQKGFAMLIYDFKFDDLSRIAYNALRKYADRYPAKPSFYVINLEKVYHRSNPLEPQTMGDITDAMEASRTIMLGLNREWIKKTGDFFVESPINFVTALFWFLRKYKDGLYCTVPHAIELAQVDYKDLFGVLNTEPEIEMLINPFISAWKNEAYDQLEGQIASAKISLARLVSPTIYYVLSGNDFSLDISNPKEPKVLCLANNPQKSDVFGAVLSLYVNRINKLVNRKHQQKCSLIFDEFPTIYFNNIDQLIATARSNKVATTLAFQDYSQLKKDYGRDLAEVIMNIAGNVIAGQVNGETAKQLSERIGKINQEKQSITINSQDTSISRSTQLDYAVPASTISKLSSGEFVGIVADDPATKIKLKAFHNEIINDHEAIKREEAAYEEIPQIREVSAALLNANFERIKEEVSEIVADILGDLPED